MLQGMMARKIGMTQIFEDDGRVIPVTVLEAGPVTVVQKKTMEKDGCDQVQVGYEAIEERKVNRPMKGHFREQAPTRFLREFKVEDIPPETVANRNSRSGSRAFGVGLSVAAIIGALFYTAVVHGGDWLSSSLEERISAALKIAGTEPDTR